MKRTNFLAALLVAVSLISTGCGNSDSIKSLLLTATGASSGSTFNLAGQDGQLQLTVFAIYNSGKRIDVTTASTFTVVNVCCDQNGNNLPPYGPTTVPINATGLMTAIAPLCTWTDAVVTTATTSAPANPPQWEYTGFYQTTANYRGFISQPVAIGVGVTASKSSPVGGCGP